MQLPSSQSRLLLPFAPHQLGHQLPIHLPPPPLASPCIVILPRHIPQLRTRPAHIDPRQMPVLLYGPVGRCPSAFFELHHVLNPGSLACQTGILPLQCQLQIGVGQRSLQTSGAFTQLLQFVNLFGLFHSYNLSSGSIPIAPNPLLHRLFAPYTVLAPDLLEAGSTVLQLSNNLHFECFTIPDHRPIFARFLFHQV